MSSILGEICVVIVLGAYVCRHEVAPGYPDDSVNYSGQYPWSFGVLFSILASGECVCVCACGHVQYVIETPLYF
jgi:hypothetical protein